MKRSVAGVGHDAAAEFNEHWWTTLYDKAAANVEVKEKDGVTKKIKTKDNQEFVITNSTWKLNKKQKDTDNEEQYSDYFVRTAVLTNGASNVERVRESDSEDDEKKDVFKMTDEELFAKCEGRTAHKGARHGLKATGKLARIAQQEALLLSQSKYSGYSHAKKLKEQVEDINLNSDSDTNERKKKKKKRKRCNSNEKPELHTTLAESEEIPLPDNNVTDDDNVASVLKEENVSRKSKKSKKKKIRHIEVIPEEDEDVSKPKKKKKGIENTEVPEIMETNTVEDMTIAEEENSMKKSKKKKKKAVES